MENNNIIPLGSIVKLKSVKDYVMLIGVQTKSDGETFDYSGCIHPYGFLGSDKILLFNKQEIEKIIFKGYEDEESKDFFEDIVWLRNNKEEK